MNCPLELTNSLYNSNFLSTENFGKKYKISKIRYVLSTNVSDMNCLQAEKSSPIPNQKSKPNLRQAKNPTVKVVELQKPFGFELTKTKFSKRFKITGMTEDGEAAKSGMKCGDNVVGLWFNGTNMTNFKWNKIVTAIHSAQSCKLELKQQMV